MRITPTRAEACLANRRAAPGTPLQVCAEMHNSIDHSPPGAKFFCSTCNAFARRTKAGIQVQRGPFPRDVFNFEDQHDQD